MDAEKAGSWAPFCVAFVLLTMAGWGLWTIPENVEVLAGNSGEDVPRFVEHFPTDVNDEVPLDDVLRISWHPEDSQLGTMKTNDRYQELGELQVVDHAPIPANAELHAMVRWSDDYTLNVTVDIQILSEIENGILRLILIEDDVEMFGRTPSQHAVVRLYDPTPIPDGNGTVQREFNLGNGLSSDDSQRLRFVILLSDMMTEENHALLAMNVPQSDNGPEDSGHRASTLLALGIIILFLTGIVRSEWKREVMLPRLRGSRDAEGRPVAHLKAGLRDLHLKEVRVLPPWRMAKEIREIDLPAGTERTIAVRVKPARGLNEVNTLTIETEWSIEVDEMGGWVLDLTLYKEPPT
jgi:hypothetical protein